MAKGLNLLPLGYPDHDDVELAARLYLEYDKAGLLERDEVCEVFAMCCYDFQAVYRRAHQIKAATDPDFIGVVLPDGNVIDDTGFRRHARQLGFRRRAWEWFMKREQAY